jgi:hypothetical protein
MIFYDQKAFEDMNGLMCLANSGQVPYMLVTKGEMNHPEASIKISTINLKKLLFEASFGVINPRGNKF